jgi:MFS family permease/quinol monooxygenase YgiN
MMKTQHSATGAPIAATAWSPFRYATFSVVWTATVVSNIGTWMYSAATGWLMTGLDADPLSVSLVQVAANLPMFLLALPAGALADIIDKRRFLIVVESVTTLVSALFAAMVWLNMVTPGSLLLFTFLIGACGALSAPGWQAVVTLLVPQQVLMPAVAANSAGVNVSRAVGPALGGAITGRLGIAAPFWINAISNLAVIAALLWWRSPQAGSRKLPAERLAGAMRAGFRYVRNSPHLRATLFRSTAFFLFASAYWALLPLVTKNSIAGGPELYGVLLGIIGAGAVGGALILPWLKKQLGADRMVASGTFGTAAAMVLYGVAREPATAVLASVLAGVSWIVVVATLNVSAQVALPEWVRARGLAMAVSVMFGAATLGSALWGQVAAYTGLPAALYLAAAGAVLAIPLTRRWKLQTGARLDLTPSLNWPPPLTVHKVEHDRGPVLVSVEYRIDPKNRDGFLAAVRKLEHGRRRDGAYRWGIYEDAASEGRFLETFMVESWLEHLRQHERTTNADRVAQDAVNRYHESGQPTTTHFIAVDDQMPAGVVAK